MTQAHTHTAGPCSSLSWNYGGGYRLSQLHIGGNVLSLAQLLFFIA